MTDKSILKSGQFSTDSKTKTADSAKLIETISEALLEKRAKNIVLLDVRELTTLTDYFIVCHGSSDTQIRALANSVTEKTKKDLGESVWKKEGMEIRRWIILDYVNIVVHIFSEEKREYYGIEKMWSDAVRTELEDTLAKDS
ncbi:ribosome silencing factor [Rhodohalobacter sp. SW132]|uniref:ribosome silencing factor n=1 Tax=Rhodohalobacter sp. SW132 TaxID=2293433 RepID=UPI000E270EE1|nr:ribosome silencing factor [Rhodohalobacter sp. SW132]REL29063.1 ribosome silencing factor [Rhodohalobacter sp. SW132]